MVQFRKEMVALHLQHLAHIVRHDEIKLCSTDMYNPVSQDKMRFLSGTNPVGACLGINSMQ